MKKESKYSIFAPIIRNNIKKQEEKLGRKLDKQEKRKFIKQDKRRLRRKATYTAVLAALGISGAVIGKKALPEGQKQQIVTEQTSNSKETRNNNFKENLKAEVQPVSLTEKEEDNNITKEIVEKYNQTYSEELTEDDIGYIRSCPQFLGIDKDGNYSFDYYGKTDIVDSVRDNDVGDLYVIVNKQNDEIISAVGQAKFNTVNVDAKQIKVGEKEYKKSDNTINLVVDEKGTEKSEEEQDKIYFSVKNAYEERLNDREIDD